MARDPRKGGAFDSGMRGREKPKVQGAHGGTFGQEDSGVGGGEKKQGASTTVGNPDGVNLNDSAYSSGMRGVEKAKQKSASGDATFGQENSGSHGGENKQGPSTIVGNPDGHNDAARGKRAGVEGGQMQSAAKDAHSAGAAGSNNSTENAASESHPEGDAGILGEEDDTHINIRIPKASLKRKNPGLQTN